MGLSYLISCLKAAEVCIVALVVLLQTEILKLN
jgi:hypothetical protein